MFSSVVVWAVRGLAGLRMSDDAADAGYARFELRPAPVAAIPAVNLTFASPRGDIECTWTVTGGGDAGSATFRLRASVPPNTRATVTMPTSLGGTLRDGALRGGARGGEAQVYDVGSGEWEFVSELTQRTVID